MTEPSLQDPVRQSVEGVAPPTDGHSVYAFHFDWNGNGEIYRYPREERLLLLQTLGGSPNLLRSPPLAILDLDGRELFTMRREKRPPLSRFVVTEYGSPVCSIGLRSILRTSYTLEPVHK